MNNRNVFFICLLLCVVAFQSCQKSTVKVGLLMHSLDNERWERDKTLITENVEKLGGEVLFRNANDDQAKQNRQAQELVDLGIDVLIVTCSKQDEAAEIVQAAHREDVKVIAYDRLIKNCDLDFYVTTSSQRVGELQAEYMTTIVPKGKYGLIIGNENDNNTLMLFIGQMNKLQEKVESGDIQIVYSEFTSAWTEEEGYRATNEILAQNDSSIDVIITGSDQLAYGIHRALKDAGLLGKVKIVSQDADLEIVKEIVKGNQAATIYKPLGEMSKKTAELAIKLARGQDLEKDYTTVSNGKQLVPSYELEPTLVTKDNISSTVIADGYHTTEEIY